MGCESGPAAKDRASRRRKAPLRCSGNNFARSWTGYATVLSPSTSSGRTGWSHFWGLFPKKRSAATARCPGGAFRIKKLPKRPETKEEEGGRRKCASGFQSTTKASRLGQHQYKFRGAGGFLSSAPARPLRKELCSKRDKCPRHAATTHSASQVFSSSACSCSSFRICSTRRLVVGSLSPIKSTIWLYASMATRSAIRLARIISFKSFDAL